MPAAGASCLLLASLASGRGAALPWALRQDTDAAPASSLPRIAALPVSNGVALKRAFVWWGGGGGGRGVPGLVLLRLLPAALLPGLGWARGAATSLLGQ